MAAAGTPGAAAPPFGAAPPGAIVFAGGAAPFGIEPTTGRPYSSKQKLVAGLLQLLVPGLGVGRFYTGHMGIAIAQIAATLCTCGLGALWPMIDGIMILVGKPTDSQGNPLRD